MEALEPRGQTGTKPKKKLNRHQCSSLAKRCRRLGLTLREVERFTKTPYGTLKHWHQGQSRTPRMVFRMLAAYRLINWGRF